MRRAPAPYASRAHRRSLRHLPAIARALRGLATVQELLQVAARAGLVEAAHVQGPAGRRQRWQAPARQLCLQFLNPDAPAWLDLPVIFGTIRPPAPIGFAGGKAHASRGAAVETDQDHFVTPAQIPLDQRRDRLRQAPAVGAIGGSVVLLIDGPPTPHTGESQFGTGQLLQHVSPLTQHLHDRTHETRVVGALTNLGVLVQEAVGDQRHLARRFLLRASLPPVVDTPAHGAPYDARVTDTRPRFSAEPGSEFVTDLYAQYARSRDALLQ